MASRSFNNSGGHVPAVHAAVTDANHGRFPQQPVPIGVGETREVNLDQLTEADFEGMRDSGLPYSDHDYIGSNPNVKCSPDPCYFPVMHGLTEQFMNGEQVDLTERPENRPISASTPLTMPGSAIRKTPVQGHQGQTLFNFRAAKGEDFANAGPSQYPIGKGVSWTKPITNVTQPKKSGRPPKNDPRELSGNRLIGRAMVKAGMEPQQGQMQGQLQHPQHHQGIHPMHEMGMNIRAAPIVTPARGQKIQPRGRSAAGPRREVNDDGSGGYGMVPVQQHIVAGQGAFRSMSASSPRKSALQIRSAQAAEDAHSREMMEAAQNALAPSNATISGHSAMMSAQNPQHQPMVMPMHPPIQQHHGDEGDLPRTPGRGIIMSPITSPVVDRRTYSESQEQPFLRQETLRAHPDGLPLTPGGARKMPTRSPRSRMSTSESTASSSQAASPQKVYTGVMSPRHQPMLPSRSIHGSPQQRPILTGAQLKSPTVGPILSLSSGPSTMASVQMQMTTNVSMPSLHHQAYQQQPVTSRHVGPPTGRAYYDVPGAQAAPLITATGSNTYTPRRRKEKESDEAVEAEVTRNVKTILLADKTQRLSTTSSHTLSPRQDTMSEDDLSPRGRHVQTPHENKKGKSSRGSPMKGKRAVKQSSKMSVDSDKDSENGEENWIVECICGTTEDDGEIMVGCDNCIRWQHVDCIFPRSKKAPEGNYLCTVCHPRVTDLTSDQARAYQDRRKEQQNKEKEDDTRKKLAERKKRKEEEMRKPASAVRTSQSKGVAPKSNEPSISTPSNYRVIEKNEYATNARRLLNLSRSSGTPNADILKTLSDKPRIRNVVVAQNNLPGLIPSVGLTFNAGDYVSELCGYITIQKEEYPNRDIAAGAGSNNDFTFLFEKDGDKIIIDARKCGNAARFVRRSCNPNAELQQIISGSEMHIMIVATGHIKENDEVTIPFDSDWEKHPSTLQGCACGLKDNCAITAFFKAQTTKMQSLQSMAASSRRSLPVNGTTPKGASSPPRRSATEKKKGGSVKKVIAKKGKKKGMIKLPRHAGKSKGESTSTAESEGEEDTEKEYEESTADEKEKEEVEEKKEEKTPKGRGGRRNTASMSEGEKKEKEMEKAEMPILTPVRSSARIRNDSEVKKEEAESPMKEEVIEKEEKASSSAGPSGGSTKRGQKSGVEVKEEEVMATPPPKKEEKPKKDKKPWPVMDYSLPSERNKTVSREEKKALARIALSENSSKRGGSANGSASRGSGTKGRGSAAAAAVATPTTTPVAPPKMEKIVSSGRGKRKMDMDDAAAKADTKTAAASTPIAMPPRKKFAAQQEMKKNAEKEKEKVPSPAPSSMASMASPLRDESATDASPAPEGKKKLLQRYQQRQRAAAAAESASAASAAKTASSSSTTSTPTRSKRSASRKEAEAVAVGGMMMMGGMKEKRKVKEEEIGIREEMRRNAMAVVKGKKAVEFTFEGRIEGGIVEGHLPPSTISSLSSTPSTSRLPPIHVPISTPIPTPPAPVEKKTISMAEYKKRKQSGGGTSGVVEETEKPESAKKSFMPSVGDTTTAAPSSLEHINLPVVGYEELSKKVYGETPKKGSASASSSSTIGPRTPEVSQSGKADPTPKRQSINDRLRNEFAIPHLKKEATASTSGSTDAATAAGAAASSSTSSISPIPSGTVTTPTSGRIHKGRLSEGRAMNMDPPGMIACPRLGTSDLPSTSSPSPSPRQSQSATQLQQRAAAIRSSFK